MIFHSNKGDQYACDEFKKVINNNEIHQSMSRKEIAGIIVMQKAFLKR